MATVGSSKKLTAAATFSLALLVLLFFPGAGAAVPSIDATLTRHLPLPRGLLRGPESVAFDGKGRGPYSGVSDGRILKWTNAGWTTYAYAPSYSSDACTATARRPETVTESSCGRPFGLRFHLRSGQLYIADAYKGLMRVGPGGGEATVLVNEVDGAPLRFTNGVDIDQLLRYWIKGPKAGTIEVLVDLPGYPDNIGADGKIVEELRGPKSVRPTEIMERKDGRLFVGSVELPYVSVIKRR
ncbi:hypothetical protein BRADI_4g06263v3 [Brachypodium distachyon]|uniref:Strictosidine synthase conserved region domain-containing protein n=1 Tax=Brachypodium distachyon TaxID=15368 RepID=A0A0Q3IK03_BRADI|nr:hypothetical protein BRADI_4g06263v3 [Brachypodium distachyon]